jgi:CO dehydrogenase/acetyl-CoA synthase epsilon subunit
MKEQIDDQTRIKLQRITAITTATQEVMAEHKEEILKRAKAKLIAMGVTVEEDDVTPIP